MTSSRADYGILQPVLEALVADPALELYLYTTGMHLAPEFGLTVEAIEKDGFQVDERLETLMASDTPAGVAKSMGNGVNAFAQSYSRFRPDVLVVVGDRYEMLPAALAALPFRIPVAHIHGGEITQGAIDDCIRHSLTKLSHLHFVSTQEYARRIAQLGEEPWRIVLSGAPSLDKLHRMELMSREELEIEYHLKLGEAPILVTFHPVTLEAERSLGYVEALLECLDRIAVPLVFTGTNADTGYSAIHDRICRYVTDRQNAFLVSNFGSRGYFSMLRCAAAMVGNSSSGIVESGSFALPVVNIGTRQQGRVRGNNVIQVGYDGESILAGISKALEPGFKKKLHGMKNLYGDGHASTIIVERLREIALDGRLIVKLFRDLVPQ